MIRINSLRLEIGFNSADLKKAILSRLKINSDNLLDFKIVKQSLDARKKADIHYNLSVDASVTDEKSVLSNRKIKDICLAKSVSYQDPITKLSSGSSRSDSKNYCDSNNYNDHKNRSFDNEKCEIKPTENRPIIIGFGPAGMFCAYKLACAGLKPIVFERGSDADTRAKDVLSFWNGGKLNTSSNVQFGEGGAGTFSDGKLNTMIHDNFGRITEVFRILIENGADESIAYLNKPHIGTDRLIQIVKNMRSKITELGGEVHFNSTLTNLQFDKNGIKEITINNSNTIPCGTLVLAIGHSARDTFELLQNRGVQMQRKAFAIGVRIQHPQEIIGRAQYGDMYKKLPAADYKLTYNTADNRGVYSFCMCPGGFVVNASSEEGRLVVNGMSNSDRSEETANSALVVSVREDDFEDEDILAGMHFQRKLEENCYKEGNGAIPVQYLKDFVQNQRTRELTENLPNTKGAIKPGNLNNFLPDFICEGIKEAMPSFGRTIKGFDDDYALLLGLESRTSSPVRIVRNDALEAENIPGLYPCGEGAGYAGGITSAAVDGIKIYEMIVNRLQSLS